VRNLSFEANCYILPANKDAEEMRKRILSAYPALLVQVANSEAVKNEALVELIAWQTRWAESSGSLLAKTAEMDLLLRLSGTSQIAAAIEKTGAKRGMKNVLIVVGERRRLQRLVRVGLCPWRRLHRGELTGDESRQVETAALLNALRA